ncbi:MAG: hypothetical protein IPL65_11010 [Lewinellaceae bacterium]|nr:hypothetical protein [Lewinellaceae bacterium]
MKKICCLLLFAFGHFMLMSQSGAIMELRLADSTIVPVVQQRSLDAPAAVYYYMPVNMRISTVSGFPEFSFLAFREDSLAPLSGGVLHLLLVWGLDKEQTLEAESLLIQKTDSSAFLAGSLFMNQDDDHPMTEIDADSNELAELLRNSLKSAARTPLNAGSKTAMSFQFDAAGAEQIEKALATPGAFKGVKLKMYFSLDNHMYGPGVPARYILEGDLESWINALR